MNIGKWTVVLSWKLANEIDILSNLEILLGVAEFLSVELNGLFVRILGNREG